MERKKNNETSLWEGRGSIPLGSLETASGLGRGSETDALTIDGRRPSGAPNHTFQIPQPRFESNSGNE